MIYKLIFICSYLFLFQNNTNIDFLGIKEIYKKDSKVSFNIKNNSSKLRSYNIGLQVYINNEWRETASDITNLNSKTTRIFKIKPNMKNLVTMNLNDRFFKGNSRLKKYRFFIELRNENSLRINENKITSNTFEIE